MDSTPLVAIMCSICPLNSARFCSSRSLYVTSFFYSCSLQIVDVLKLRHLKHQKNYPCSIVYHLDEYLHIVWELHQKMSFVFRSILAYLKDHLSEQFSYSIPWWYWKIFLRHQKSIGVFFSLLYVVWRDLLFHLSMYDEWSYTEIVRVYSFQYSYYIIIIKLVYYTTPDHSITIIDDTYLTWSDCSLGMVEFYTYCLSFILFD
jgi:hypothetical protein